MESSLLSFKALAIGGKRTKEKKRAGFGEEIITVFDGREKEMKTGWFGEEEVITVFDVEKNKKTVRFGKERLWCLMREELLLL